MQRFRDGLATFGEVHAFDYPYMQAGRRTPDRMPKLLQAHAEALAAARQHHTGKVVLIGKSMGGRVGCHLSLEQPVDALVCLGYPLKGMSKTAGLRNEILEKLRTPILFVQGTRDSLCPLDLLQKVREKMTAVNELFVVESGNHSLECTKRHLAEVGKTQAQVESEVFSRIERFIAHV